MNTDDNLIPGIDYDVAVCDACGRDEHTPAELVECIDSMVGGECDHSWDRWDDGLGGNVQWYCMECREPAPERDDY